jgi:TPR repeat protein
LSILYAGDSLDIAEQAIKDKNYNKAESYYRKSCDSGLDKGCLGLVNLYVNKKGKYQSDIVAFKLSVHISYLKEQSKYMLFSIHLYTKRRSLCNTIISIQV